MIELLASLLTSVIKQQMYLISRIRKPRNHQNSYTTRFFVRSVVYI